MDSKTQVGPENDGLDEGGGFADPGRLTTHPGVPVEMDGHLADRALIVELSGASSGRVHCLVEPEVTMGRAPGCHLQWADMTLSRRHARIFRLAGQWVLEDLDSLNGTFVNRDRIQHVVLSNGDIIRLGQGALCRFHVATREEEEALQRVYNAASRDGLTGVYNRRHLDEYLSAELSFAVRHHTNLAVVMLDLDHFKNINDQHGHLAGDAVLKQVAAALASNIRAEDVLCRYGGEEFVVVARSIPLEGAKALSARLRQCVERQEVEYAGLRLKVTVSLGIATLEGWDGKPTVQGLLELADHRLYRAKAGGRNRMVWSED